MVSRKAFWLFREQPPITPKDYSLLVNDWYSPGGFLNCPLSLLRRFRGPCWTSSFDLLGLMLNSWGWEGDRFSKWDLYLTCAFGWCSQKGKWGVLFRAEVCTALNLTSVWSLHTRRSLWFMNQKFLVVWHCFETTYWRRLWAHLWGNTALFWWTASGLWNLSWAQTASCLPWVGEEAYLSSHLWLLIKEKHFLSLQFGTVEAPSIWLKKYGTWN